MEKKAFIHKEELHLLDKQLIHSAVKDMANKLGLAAGSTQGFDLYKVVETYFEDLEKRKEINSLLGIEE
ncbi:MAG: hypothetical protein SOR57_11175 [Parabacteroides sp.]|nr:hypothetical protein [Parabacteroides sp.]